MPEPERIHHTIRVYFHYGEKSDYSQLKESLKFLGILDIIRQLDGQSFQLPQGEFYIQSEKNSEEIREMVYEVASQIGKASVIVSSGKRIAWVGLESTG